MDALMDLYLQETGRKSVEEYSEHFENWLHRKTVDELEVLLSQLEKSNVKASNQKTRTATD